MAETTAKKRTTTKKTATAEKKTQETAPIAEEVKTETTEKPAERTFTEADVQAMVAEAVAKAMASVQTQQTPQIVQVAADVERVQFLYMAEVADDNVYEIGPQGMYGRIVGKTGGFTVPKTDLSRVMDSMFRMFLEKRWIIAVSGLSDEEREAYGVDYRDGELLDKRAFARMVELGEKMIEIYPQLCKGHREMVAKRYYEAYISGSRHIKRDTVVELNSISRQIDGGEGAFSKIIELMNAADLKK